MFIRRISTLDAFFIKEYNANPLQQLAMSREKVIEEVGRKSGLKTIILRPARTIGTRDIKSFFLRMLAEHSRDQFPLVNNGEAKISLVDTRDLGRAMVWLGTPPFPKDDNGIYLLKGFDTTWGELKEEMDRVTGQTAKTLNIPSNLTEKQMLEKGLSPFTMKSLATNRVWDDRKLRNRGFEPKYSLRQAVEAAVQDIRSRLN